MRISDILKKNAKPAEPGPEKPEPRQVPSLIPQKQEAKKQVQPKPETNLAAVHLVSAEQPYSKAIIQIKYILSNLRNNNSYNCDLSFINEFVDLLAARNSDLLLLADKATPDIYLYGHSVNVCVYSLLLGQAAGLSRSELVKLGQCAFLHDIGMAKLLDTALKTTKLTPMEVANIRNHVKYSQELIGLLAGLDDTLKSLAVQVIAQTHERKNGSGYPLGLKDEEIHKFAAIISITDTYEAITHPRAYRARLIPHEAVKNLISGAGSDFDPLFVKLFVEHISLYPPGTYVRLNSEEIARVLGINLGLPTRPRVKIIINSQGMKIFENKTVDLSSTPMLFVKEPVDETKLNLTDKKLALELKAMRWWVKGL
ncbi:MAG TPA: hypothetical protein DEE98_02780 [Elusimicrobia bacterium]|nr:MAG: hypothetical protein A2278_07610 [Elusimicrobia bacterium RIFOXYA12_FULL_49_49]OGS16067.1 MAG: hypothetical protein A2251_02655 [Elusimicrobia bacterium RIFOXYA2_FULL_47_53]OGS26693.1 MAG: hypothetical protein A2339_03705 [Elusimicrobia bacterium RIFOXYB12_FULL_50_12]OGS30181.1 MAG: hypothetical protein A2323_01880 [Elusimicrobia bacterium RIFOXYB2_FULL_46_23]HBU69290.1 hypothetical protein [Elusimicrobiota bacterium]